MTPVQDHLWYPPGPSRASRSAIKPSRGASRVRIVAGHPRREMRLESYLEAKAAFILLARRETADLQEQPAAIAYRDADGISRRHTFDFLQTLRDGTRILIAVKPWQRAIETDLPRTLRQIAKHIDPAVADKVALLTDRRLGRDAVHNARLMLSVGADSDPAADAIVTDAIANLPGATTLREIAQSSGLNGRGFRASIRLIVAGRLAVAAGARLTPATRVWLAAADAS